MGSQPFILVHAVGGPPIMEKPNLDWYTLGIDYGLRLGWEAARKQFLATGSVAMEPPFDCAVSDTGTLKPSENTLNCS